MLTRSSTRLRRRKPAKPDESRLISGTVIPEDRCGVCGWYTQIPCDVLHTGIRIIRTRWASRFTYRAALTKSISSEVRVLDFTYTLRVVFYNRGDQPGALRMPNPSQTLPGFSRSVPSHTVSSVPSASSRMWHRA
jgi:hypothetical protein